MTEQKYTPPKVWTASAANGGKFGKLNSATAGPRVERELPTGVHPFQLYSLATPNGVKVTILFEELLQLGFEGAEYDAHLIDIMAENQFSTGFTAINPNSKIPAMLDRSTQPPTRVFESGSILLYLAETFGAFVPNSPQARTETLNWLFWQMGSAPLLGGGFGHFYAYAPEYYEYPINRYAMETKRQLDVLNRELADKPYIAGNDYTIADMAIWPWYGELVLGRLYSAAEFLAVHDYPNLLRWAEHIDQRPAVKRGRMVNRNWGEPHEQLPERHSAADFDRDT